MLIHTIGGKGGDAFQMNYFNDGATLKRMWVWVGSYTVTGLRFWFSNGQNRQLGRPQGDYLEFEFGAGEFFTHLSLWGNGIGTRLGAIKFTTNHGRKFFAKMTWWSLQTEYPINVGSGICVGVTGRHGHEIDSLGFMFINTIRYTVMKNVCYPTLNSVKPQVVPKEIKSVSYKNDTSVAQQHKIEASETITKKSSWSMTKKLKINRTFEVKAGIPEVAEVSAGFSFTVGVESTHTLEETESHTETVSFPVTVPPGKTIDIDITIGKVTIDLPFTAIVEINCHDGSVMSYNTSGNYKGLTYTEVKVVTKEID